MRLTNDVHPHEGGFTEADLQHHGAMQTLKLCLFFFFFFANADQSSTNSHSQLLHHVELIQALMWILTSICSPCICHTHPCINSRASIVLDNIHLYVKEFASSKCSLNILVLSILEPLTSSGKPVLSKFLFIIEQDMIW